MSLVDVTPIGGSPADCAVCEVDTYYRLVRPDGGHVPPVLKPLALTEDRTVAQRIADGDANAACECGHADVDHFHETGECRAYFTSSDGRLYPCECNELRTPHPLPQEEK